MGSKEKIIVIIENYSCECYNMKGLESVINKRIIRLFANADYECYLIDEYNTSKLFISNHTIQETKMICESSFSSP